jgi:hypothetical protein
VPITQTVTASAMESSTTRRVENGTRNTPQR